MTNDTQQETLPRSIQCVGSFISAAATRLTRALLGMFTAAERWLFSSKKSLYGLAVTRMLMGAAAIGLLASNFRTRYYAFGSGSAWNGEATDPGSEFVKIPIFSLFHRIMGNDLLLTVYYLGLFVLAGLIIVGWRFKLVLPVFFVLWVSFIEAHDMLGDQGDNMYRIILLLMMFADPAARWSLDAKRRAVKPTFMVGSVPNQIGTVFHNLALVALAAQVIFVYTSGALFKAGGAPWRGGWAVYDPLQTARFGNWPALSDFVTAWGPLVAMITLSTLFLQAGFPFMLLNRTTRVIALLGILGFHIGIAVLMGLPWFSLTMIAVDAIFIRDQSWQKVAALFKQRSAAAELARTSALRGI